MKHQETPLFNRSMDRDKLDNILGDLRERLTQILGDRLEAVYLYGSRARGDAQPDSDIDVLVVIQGEFDYFDLSEKTSQLTADISLENDTVITKFFVSKYDFDHRKTLLV